MGDSPRRTADPAEAPTSPRSLPIPPQVVFWVTAVGVAVVATLHNLYAFRAKIFEDGDFASNSLLAISAQHFDQFVGNYSRVGFHHPGPALIYVLAAGQFLFFSVLHVVPGQFNGQLLGVIVFVSVLLGLAVTTLYRATRSLAAAGVALGVILVVGPRFGLLAQLWFPFLYMAPFLLLMVAGAALAAGRTVELPSFVLAGCLLVHGHVSFILFVAVTTVAVAVSWWTVHRRHGRTELAAHRRGVIGSAVILGLALLPMLVELVLHFPGPWPDYGKYSSTGHDHRTAGDVLRFFGWFWSPGSRIPAVLLLVAAVVAVVLLGTERSAERRRVLLCLYGMLALQSVLLLVYVARGVDQLIPRNRYVGYFYLTVPMLLLVAAAVHLSLRLESAVVRSHAAIARAGRLIPAAAAIALVLAGCLGSGLKNRLPRHAYVGPAVTALQRAPGRDGRTVQLDFNQKAWSLTLAIALESERRGLPWCVVDRGSDGLTFGTNHLCRGTAARWTVAVLQAQDGAAVPDRPGMLARTPRAVIVPEPGGPGTVH